MEEFFELIRNNYVNIYKSDIEITAETNIINDLQYDSLSFITLMAEVEEHYNIEIVLDDLEKLSNVMDFYRYIQVIRNENYVCE